MYVYYGASDQTRPRQAQNCEQDQVKSNLWTGIPTRYGFQKYLYPVRSYILLNNENVLSN